MHYLLNTYIFIISAGSMLRSSSLSSAYKSVIPIRNHYRIILDDATYPHRDKDLITKVLINLNRPVRNGEYDLTSTSGLI